MSDSLTLYKLIILFMLDKVDFPLTTSQISEFIHDFPKQDRPQTAEC